MITVDDFQKVDIRVEKILSMQIGKHVSEVLTLGVPDGEGNVVLVHPGKKVSLGGKLF